MGNTVVWSDDPGNDLGDEKEKMKHRKMLCLLKGCKKGGKWFFSLSQNLG